MLKNIPLKFFELFKLFKLIIRGDRLSAPENELLLNETIKNTACFNICDLSNLDIKEIKEIIDQRSQLLRLVYVEVSQSLTTHNIHIDPPDAILFILWHYWLPLAQSLAKQQQQIGRTLIQGLLGGQGTGKTSLGIILQILLSHFGKTFLSISLDDIYKTYADRQKMQVIHPDLIWRGPPSTHDVELGIQVLQQLRDRNVTNPKPIAIPRFDKSLHHGTGDRVAPEISYGADIILFEGWFVGMRPLPVDTLDNFVTPILSASDRKIAIACNANLHKYAPLWEYLDRLIVIIPENYKYSLQWRLEAEHNLMAAGKAGMSDQQISQFVEYFWKALHPQLFIPPLIDRTNANYCADHSADLVVEISRSHLPTRIYQKT
jgi:D-glycerate 3-kinase